jgi:putative transposase
MNSIRIDVPDITYHVYSRGNNKSVIYLDERDRLVHLKIWQTAKLKFDFRMYAYALMDNHFHFLIKILGHSRLGRLMHYTQLMYARYFNQKYGRVGHVFQSRYRNIPVETDRYFLTLVRYIELNPVRAGLVSKPDYFHWSSYNDRLCASPSEWIDHAAVLDYFGQDPSKQRDAYRTFINEAIGTPEEWTPAVLDKTTYLGSPEFGHKIRGLQEKNLYQLINPKTLIPA